MQVLVENAPPNSASSTKSVHQVASHARKACRGMIGPAGRTRLFASCVWSPASTHQTQASPCSWLAWLGDSWHSRKGVIALRTLRCHLSVTHQCRCCRCVWLGQAQMGVARLRKPPTQTLLPSVSMAE